MDDFARRGADERGAFIQQAASLRDLTPLIIEKDFWVCWTLRRLTTAPALRGHVTFKGGTSLSKAYGIIQRFSEDVDLTIRGTAPRLDAIASPMEAGITGGERKRRIKALKAAAQEYVATIAMQALTEAIQTALGTAEGWSIELDPEDAERQTLLFHYPQETVGRDAVAYIKPRLKLEFGARGDPEPSELKSITPYVAESFPHEFADAATSVDTLSVVRTYWEKATILHALRHNGKLRSGMSRHYYDLLMLDHAGVTDAAVADPELLAQVVRNKSLMFADPTASYDTAELGGLRLLPAPAFSDALAADYAAMTDMFIEAAPSFNALLKGLETLEARLNGAVA